MGSEALLVVDGDVARSRVTEDGATIVTFGGAQLTFPIEMFAWDA